MAKHIHVHVHTRDTFSESDHPRAKNGQFGSGGGGAHAPGTKVRVKSFGGNKFGSVVGSKPHPQGGHEYTIRPSKKDGKQEPDFQARHHLVTPTAKAAPSQKPGPGGGGALPMRVGAGGGDVNSAQNIQARIDAKKAAAASTKKAGDPAPGGGYYTHPDHGDGPDARVTHGGTKQPPLGNLKPVNKLQSTLYSKLRPSSWAKK